MSTLYSGGVTTEGSTVSEMPAGESVMEGGMSYEGVPMEGTIYSSPAIEGSATPSTVAPAKPPAAATKAPASNVPSKAPSPAPALATPPKSGAPPAATDDLFDNSDIQEMPGDNAPAGGAAPATDTPAEKPAEGEGATDDLFGSSRKGGISVESLSLTDRKWVDNTGRFGTAGRLIAIGETFVRLVKSNGRNCTVPFSRLCDADYAYVQAQAQTVGVQLPVRLATSQGLPLATR